MEAGTRPGVRRRGDRNGFVALTLAIYLAAAIVATWPAIRHAGDHYLARPAPGYGEAAAGDHLQLGWAFWLRRSPARERRRALGGPLLIPPRGGGAAERPGLAARSAVLAARACARAGACVQRDRPALVPGGGGPGVLVAARTRASAGEQPSPAGSSSRSRPTGVGQSTGHLLGLVSFLLPALLLALERRRWWWAGAALVALPLSGQLHLALGAIVLCLGYAWARLPRGERRWAGAVAAAGAAEPGSSFSRPSSRARSRRDAHSSRCGAIRPSSRTSSRAGSATGSRSSSSPAGWLRCWPRSGFW